MCRQEFGRTAISIGSHKYTGLAFSSPRNGRADQELIVERHAEDLAGDLWLAYPNSGGACHAGASPMLKITATANTAHRSRYNHHLKPYQHKGCACGWLRPGCTQCAQHDAHCGRYLRSSLVLEANPLLVRVVSAQHRCYPFCCTRVGYLAVGALRDAPDTTM